MTSSDLKALLKRVVELVMPNLRAYYRVVRKARVVKTYPSGGVYYADVQPLRNDESDDPNEPVVSHVEIPIIWAGPKRGVVCPPEVGSFCDLSYYDGDPDYPRISNFRWWGMGAPAEDVSGFRIQQKPDVFIRIAPNGDILRETVENISDYAWKTWSATAKIQATITAPLIVLNGEVMVTGGISASGGINAAGDIHSDGEIMDETGNSDHHSHGDGA
jgi:hypothetical protein